MGRKREEKQLVWSGVAYSHRAAGVSLHACSFIVCYHFLCVRALLGLQVAIIPVG